MLVRGRAGSGREHRTGRDGRGRSRSDGAGGVGPASVNRPPA